MNRPDTASGLVWLGIAIFVGIKAVELGIGPFSAPGPGLVLFCASLLFGILAIALVVRSFLGHKEGTLLSAPFRGLKWGKALTVMIAIFLYTAFLETVGFLLMTFGLVAVLFALGGVNRWVSITGSIATVIVVYVLFHFGLQAQFPRGILAW